MSIASEISRIQSNRNAIRAKLQELGLALPTDDLEAIVEAVEGIVNCGAVSATVGEGDTYTIPKGYHNGSGTVSGVSGDGGSYNLQSKTVTPTKEEQNITPDDGYFGLSGVIVAPIPGNYQDVAMVTAEAEDVLAGKIFVDSSGQTVVGTMPNNGQLSKTFDGLTETSAELPAGYISGGTVSLTDDIEDELSMI